MPFICEQFVVAMDNTIDLPSIHDYACTLLPGMQLFLAAVARLLGSFIWS